jgi:ribosomal-protein-alanine N-acetyltransferase
MDIFETKRIILKNITPTYLNQIFAENTERDILAEFGLEEADYNKLKERVEGGLETHAVSVNYFLMLEKSSLNVVGECGFHNWNKLHHKAELFYAMRSDEFKKQGFMSEAVTLVIAYGFNHLNLHRIEVKVSPLNIPSIRIIEKNGFIKEGFLREDYFINDKYENSEIYSLLKSEYTTSPETK